MDRDAVDAIVRAWPSHVGEWEAMYSYDLVREAVKGAFSDLVLPPHIEFGGVMETPCCMIVKDDGASRISSPIVAMATYITTDDVSRETLAVSLQRFFDRFVDSGSLFIYQAPCPLFAQSPDDEVRWSFRYRVQPGAGWGILEDA